MSRAFWVRVESDAEVVLRFLTSRMCDGACQIPQRIIAAETDLSVSRVAIAATYLRGQDRLAYERPLPDHVGNIHRYWIPA